MTTLSLKLASPHLTSPRSPSVGIAGRPPVARYWASYRRCSVSMVLAGLLALLRLRLRRSEQTRATRRTRPRLTRLLRTACARNLAGALHDLRSAIRDPHTPSYPVSSESVSSCSSRLVSSRRRGAFSLFSSLSLSSSLLPSVACLPVRSLARSLVSPDTRQSVGEGNGRIVRKSLVAVNNGSGVERTQLCVFCYCSSVLSALALACPLPLLPFSLPLLRLPDRGPDGAGILRGVCGSTLGCGDVSGAVCSASMWRW